MGGTGLTAFAAREYVRTKVLSSTLLSLTGACGIASTILGIVAWNERCQAQSPKLSGASLIATTRSDPTTLEGACRILGISTEKSTDAALIEKRKTQVLADLTKTLTKLGIDPSSPAAQPSSYGCAIELMIQDVKDAYATLTKAK